MPISKCLLSTKFIARTIVGVFIACGFTAHSSHSPVAPIIPADWVIEKKVMTRISLQDKKQLIDFDACVKFAPLEKKNWIELFDYSRCPHRQTGGNGKVIRIAEEIIAGPSTLNADSYVLSIAFDQSLTSGIFHVPSSGVQLVYSDCRGNLYKYSPCLIGNEVNGQIVFHQNDTGSISLDLDLMILIRDVAFQPIAGGKVSAKRSVKLNRHFELDPQERK